MDADGQSSLRLLELPTPVHGVFDEDRKILNTMFSEVVLSEQTLAQHTRTVVALSLHLAFSLLDHNNNDDLIAVIKHISNPSKHL